MPDYQIRVDGLRGESLVPYAEALAKIAAPNTRRSEYERTKLILQVPEQAREKVNAELDYNLDKAPFFVSDDTILLGECDWGTMLPEMEDVVTLSNDHPERIFFFTIARDNEGPVNIEQLTNYWRGRIQGGMLTAQYAAAPVVWSEKSFF